MRPTIRFLEEGLVKKILAEAVQVLCKIGVEVHNQNVVFLLAEHGARVEKDGRHVVFTEELIRKSIAAAPRSFKLFDTLGGLTHDFAGENVYFTPGSAALHILEYPGRKMRRPITFDYVRFAKLTAGLDHIASQATALIPADVDERISDSYRLFLSLLYCKKPVVTGAFTIESFGVM
jgi:trimethylamine--corrinoid protein Co-methyltransferase